MAIYSDRHPAFKFTGDISRYPAGPAQFARAMEELGIRQIFARSPQAKGRVERAAATFQDRLVTELRLAGAATIDEANEVLSSFLPRFNERFGVLAEQDCPAYRPVEHWVSLEQTLCFRYPRKVARDNTLKYNRRTLQLLPDGTRPSYAGLQVEVQEDLEGRLLVQYLGQTIPNQEAPPRPSLLKTTNSAPPDEHRRGPMARQRTLWEEVQQARLRGLALRAIARELGIHRNTAQKYAQAESLPVRLINITPQVPSPDAEGAA